MNTQLAEEIVREKEQKKEEQEKKRADDLWSSFMSDVGKGPPKKAASAPAGSGLGSLGSINRVSLILYMHCDLFLGLYNTSCFCSNMEYLIFCHTYPCLRRKVFMLQGTKPDF